MSFSVTSSARGTLSQAVENHSRNNHLRTRLRVNYQVRVLRKTEKIQGTRVFVEDVVLDMGRFNHRRPVEPCRSEWTAMISRAVPRCQKSLRLCYYSLCCWKTGDRGNSSLYALAVAEQASVALGINTTLPTVLRLASASNACFTSCSVN